MEDGCAIVIGLQSTGEASAQVAMKELSDQYGKIEFSDILLPTLVSTARSILTNFVNDHFPVKPQIPEPPHVPELSSDASDVMKAYVAHLQAENTRIKSLPPPQPIPQLVERQKILLNAAKSLALPPNPLDDLIDRLGGTDLVAELTGRSGRIVRHKDGKHYQYTRRIQESSNQKVLGLSMPKNTEDFDKLNIVEKKRFMEKNKKVAIISDAASTGISLHAAAGSGNCHRRRVHLTIELPWAADAAIQQLGRSHRSGQTSAPVYEMIVTELGGERRFGAAVAKRMANLGALTKGDRRAATGSDLSGFDIDSKYGQCALTRLLQSFDVLSISNAPSRNSSVLLEEYTKQNLPESVSMDDTQLRIHALGVVQQCMIDVDILSEHGRQKKVDVKKFLNRLAQIPVQKQKLTFSLFMSTLDDVVAEAKATGAFEGSVEDIRATRIDLDGIPEKLATDKRSGAETKLIRLILDRGVSLKAMLAQSLHDAGIDADDERSRVAKSGFYLSKRLVAGRQLILYAKRKVDPTDRGEYKPDPLGLMVVTRPNTGKNQCEMSTIDLRFKYKLMVSSKNLKKDVNGHKCEGEGAVDHVELLRANHPRVAKEWEKAYTDSFSLVVNAGLAPRRSKLGLVTGAVLHVLPVLEKAVVMSRQAERALKVARVEISGSGKRFVGIRFPLDGAVLAELKTLLATKTEVSKQHISHTTEFKDDAYMPLDPKLSKWATSEPKTMRSFFAVASKPSSAAKRKADVIPLNSTPKNNKMKSTSSNQASKPTKKKSKTSASIKSFFGARR